MNGDPYVGVIVGDYTITERVGAGQIGTVYKAVRSEPNDVVACKVIPEGKLRPGWQTEIEKNILLRGIANVVPYHSFGTTFDKANRPFTYVLFDYIDGWNLEEFCRTNQSAVTLAFVEGLTRTVLTVLHACKAVGFPHGDLHEGNILVRKPDPRIPGAPETLWISDFGYGGSRNHIQPKDDYRQMAAITNALLRSIDSTSLTARDKLVREKLLVFASRELLEHDPTQGIFVTNPELLLRRLNELIRQAEVEAAAPLSKPHTPDPADYLSAEALGHRKEEWLDMFVPEFLAAEELLSRNITILTGARGCGKTMSFRRLTKFMDLMIGKPSGVRGSDQFIGFYMNCRDLAEAFPWLPRKLTPSAGQQLLHYFHLNWLAEILRTLGVSDSEQTEDHQWLWVFMAKHFPDYSAPLQGVNPLSHARAYVEASKESCRLSPLGKGISPERWSVATLDFLDLLQAQLQASVSWSRDRPFYLFLDDYTIPIIPRSVQRVLNTVIFRRRDQIFFKVSTEAATSFDLTGLRNKPLELQQDFQMIDLATASLHQPYDDKCHLLESIFRPRIDRHPTFKGRSITLEALLGPSPFSNTELARRMRNAAEDKGKRTIMYQGVQAFVGLWTSDFRTLIQVFVDMLRESGDLTLPEESTAGIIRPAIQDKIVRSKGGEFLVFIENLTNPDQWDRSLAKRLRSENYGQHLRDIIEAFIGICKWEMTHGELVKNQTLLNPKQAFRLEVLDKFELSRKATPYYLGLVRWHLLLQDWRGKSARGMLTPRLFLNRILLPYANLTFSSHDNIGLSNAELGRLLEEPKTFPGYWAKKQRRRSSNSNQQRIEFDEGPGNGDSI